MIVDDGLKQHVLQMQLENKLLSNLSSSGLEIGELRVKAAIIQDAQQEAFQVSDYGVPNFITSMRFMKGELMVEPPLSVSHLMSDNVSYRSVIGRFCPLVIR